MINSKRFGMFKIESKGDKIKRLGVSKRIELVMTLRKLMKWYIETELVIIQADNDSPNEGMGMKIMNLKCKSKTSISKIKREPVV